MKRDVLACFFLIVLILGFLNRGVRMRGVFFGADEIGSDLLHFSYPYREFWATEYLKKGKIPLWNPYIASGLPMLAEAQTGIFFPVTVVLYALFSPPIAFNWLIVSSFLFVALGTYAYARTIGLSRIASWFSAAVFSLSGFMVGHLRHVPILTALVPMPFFFVVVENILARATIGRTMLLAGLVSVSLLAGHYTTTYLMLFILTIYFLIRLGRSEDIRMPLAFFGAIGWAGLIAAVQLLPSLELVGYSTRQSTELLRAVSTGSNYAWRYLLFFLNPYLLGDPSRATWNMEKVNFWENIGYLGVIPLIFCIAAFFMKTRSELRAKGAMKLCLVVSFLLMLGFLTPLYNTVSDALPGFSITRISGRFLVFVDFFGALLAGFGLEMVTRRLRGGRRVIGVTAISILAIADLFYFFYPFNTVMPLSYFSEPSTAHFIKARDKGLYRINSVALPSWIEAWRTAGGWRGNLAPYMDQREVIPPDLNLLYRLATPAIIYELAGHFSVKRPGELDSYALQLFANGEGKEVLATMWGMMNVKYIINHAAIDDVAGLTLIKKTNHAYIYENERYLPRAYVVGSGKHVRRATDVLPAILTGAFDPQKEVLLEGVADVPETPGSGQVAMETYTDTNVVLNATIQKSGFVVLSDTFYPGWQATIDGKPAPILRANYAYRALRVDAGDHRIVFTYDPPVFRIGAAVSLAGMIIFGGMMVFVVYRRVRTRFLKFGK